VTGSATRSRDFQRCLKSRPIRPEEKLLGACEESGELDEKVEFSVTLTRKMGEIGLFGMFVSEEYGGQGLDYISYIIAGKLSSLHVPIFLCPTIPLLRHSNIPVCRRYMPDLPIMIGAAVLLPWSSPSPAASFVFCVSPMLPFPPNVNDRNDEKVTGKNRCAD
jgi:hypothetical protein